MSIIVSLAAGSDRLSLEISFENRVLDHRLRILFPSDIAAQISHSEGQFDVVEQAIRPQPVPPDAWEEDAPDTFAQQSWMDLSDGQRGLCIINQGLPEYQVLDTPRREIAITLLRAVGYLAAGKEMQTANSGAGPNFRTPEAQIQRTLTYRLAILPHAGTWDQAEVWRAAHAHNVHPQAITVERLPWQQGERRSSASMLEVDGRNAVLDAVKQAEQDDTLIVRLHNPSNDATQAMVRLPFAPAAVWRVGLDEEPSDGQKKELLASDHEVYVDLDPKQIVTLKIERKPAG